MEKKIFYRFFILILIVFITLNSQNVTFAEKEYSYIDFDNFKLLNETRTYLPAWTTESDQAEASLGYSVNSAGDVNGDGYDDIIIGAPYYDNGLSNQGRVYVFYGSPEGFESEPNWIVEGDQAGAQFGFSVSCAGDVNDDGYDDVIVGAPEYSGAVPFSGKIYLYLGSSSGLSSTPNWTALPTLSTQSKLGYSVSTAGDINGDGYDDVIVGAPYHNEFYGNGGAAFVYHGNSGGLGGVAWSFLGTNALQYLGISVSTAGDVNGDGYSDILVGDRAWEDTHVFHGSYTGLSTSPNYKLEGNQGAAYFGNSVNSAGDVNGDGFDDVIIGAYLYDNDQTDEGRAFVYHGSTTGLSTKPNWTVEGDQDGAYLGYSVNNVGDVNNDGFDDVIVGAYKYTNDEIDEGYSYIYPGSASGVLTTPIWAAESNQERAKYGYSVSSAGDINNDDYDEILIGAPAYDNGETNEGQVFVYINTPPIADGGSDQTVNINTLVELDGSSSSDPDEHNPLSYQWTQTGGTNVTLSSDTIVDPTFTSPSEATTLTFSLVVKDSLGMFSSADEVTITVVNLAPISDAGPDQTVSTSDLTTLDGSSSYDPEDNLPLTYYWEQTGGPTVSLSDSTIVNPTFTATDEPSTLTFSLVVTNSLGLPDLTPDEVVINVVNFAPIAYAGPDQFVDTKSLVTLDGNGSSDPDEDLPLGYFWTQISGPTVTLSSQAVVDPTFTAPDDPAELTFSLVVIDSAGLPDSSPDKVVITVNNQAPIADAGSDQSVKTLSLVTLDGSLSSDPDGDTPLIYQWSQLSGTEVTLIDDTIISPTFTAPANSDTLIFSLIVTDSLGSDSIADTVSIEVHKYKFFLPLIVN